MIDKITWLGHATFKINAGTKVLYIDPWKLKGKLEPADIILVGHSHYDHFSPADIQKISNPMTILVVPGDCAKQLKGHIKIMKPGDVFTLDDVTIESVPAYNPNKTFHPKANKWMGFIVTLEGERLYYASDTDLIPEMKEVGNIDVALLPVGGTYTMNPEEAAEAAEIIGPEIAVPCHYGDIVGSEEDARRFASLYSGKTRIMNPQ